MGKRHGVILIVVLTGLLSCFVMYLLACYAFPAVQPPRAAIGSEPPSPGAKPVVKLFVRVEEGRVLRYGIEDVPDGNRLVDCIVAVELVSSEGSPVYRVTQCGHCGEGGKVMWGIDPTDLKPAQPIYAFVKLYCKASTEDTRTYRLVDDQLADLRRPAPER